jgi:hypothetical protein
VNRTENGECETRKCNTKAETEVDDDALPAFRVELFVKTNYFEEPNAEGMPANLVSGDPLPVNIFQNPEDKKASKNVENDSGTDGSHSD